MFIPRNLSSPTLNLKYLGSFVVLGLIDATSKAGLAVTAVCGRSGTGTMTVPTATAMSFWQMRGLKEDDGCCIESIFYYTASKVGRPCAILRPIRKPFAGTQMRETAESWNLTRVNLNPLAH
jgi:hypothetical protein